jgi:hypothetical protein
MGKSMDKKNVSDVKLAMAKRETGYRKIKEGTPLIVSVFYQQDKTKPGLSKERLRLILQFIRSTFQSELVEAEKSTTGPTGQPFIATILVLKLSLEEAIDDIK